MKNKKTPKCARIFVDFDNLVVAKRTPSFLLIFGAGNHYFG
jgi:hypothetical protein